MSKYAGMVKKQSRLGSLLESSGNVAVGFFVALFAWEYMVRPLFKSGHLSEDNSIYITIIFTIISLIRSYVVRRVVEWWRS